MPGVCESQPMACWMPRLEFQRSIRGKCQTMTSTPDSKNRGRAMVLIVALIVTLPGIYLLSFGPAMSYWSTPSASEAEKFNTFYAPIWWAIGRWPSLGRIMDWYIGLW